MYESLIFGTFTGIFIRIDYTGKNPVDNIDRYRFYRIISCILFIVFIPIFLILYILVKSTSRGPFLFTQIRAGKDKKPFRIHKIRTMYVGAEIDQVKYRKLNEADGPVFKIRNDPRFTKIGRLLAHSGLDELPQLINSMKGEMSFVGPRPLPIAEANKIPKQYVSCFSVLRGMTSIRIVHGTHKLDFEEWTKDSSILFNTAVTIVQPIIPQIVSRM